MAVSAPLHKRIVWRLRIYRRKLKHTVWIPPAINLWVMRRALQIGSLFADCSRDQFISPDLQPEVRPEPERNWLTISRSLGEVCRLPWPVVHVDMHFHYTVSHENPKPPKEIVATINIRSRRVYVPTLIQLVVKADGEIRSFRTQAAAVFDPGLARVAFVIPFKREELMRLANARKSVFDLYGLRFPLKENAKRTIRQLVSYDGYKTAGRA